MLRVNKKWGKDGSRETNEEEAIAILWVRHDSGLAVASGGVKKSCSRCNFQVRINVVADECGV